MKLKERLKKIDEYFENMPLEVFEEKLIKAGYGKIKPGPLAIDDTITEEDMIICNDKKKVKKSNGDNK